MVLLLIDLFLVGSMVWPHAGGQAGKVTLLAVLVLTLLVMGVLWLTARPVFRTSVGVLTGVTLLAAAALGYISRLVERLGGNGPPIGVIAGLAGVALVALAIVRARRHHHDDDQAEGK